MCISLSADRLQQGLGCEPTKVIRGLRAGPRNQVSVNVAGAVGLLVDHGDALCFQLLAHHPRQLAGQVPYHRALLVHSIRVGGDLVAVVDEVLALGGNSIEKI